MNILILTPINPVLNVDVTQEMTKMFPSFGENKKEVDILSFPFFADVESRMKGQKYIPTYFSMISAFLYDKKLQRKLISNKHTVVIGNIYKETMKFDMIVAYHALSEEEKDDDSVPFDNYLALHQDLHYKGDNIDPFDYENLYTPEDAEIILPTIHHLKLFMEGVFD